MPTEEANEELTRLWTRAQPVVAAFVRAALGGGGTEADDLLQDVAIALLRKFHAYDRALPFSAWAIGMARYEVLAHRRRRATDRLVFDEEAISAVAAAYERVGPELGARGEALEQCVARAREQDRKLLELRYVAGFDVTEIALRLGLGDSAVKVSLHRLRQRLRDCIEERLARRGIV